MESGSGHARGREQWEAFLDELGRRPGAPLLQDPQRHDDATMRQFEQTLGNEVVEVVLGSDRHDEDDDDGEQHIHRVDDDYSRVIDPILMTMTGGGMR
eukprot:COSAG01_NODE_8918_length_2614_cov_1.600398_3_plen_98_part_00